MHESCRLQGGGGAHFVRLGWSTAQVTLISSAARPSGLTSPLKSFTATGLPSCSARLMLEFCISGVICCAGRYDNHPVCTLPC